MKSLATLGVLLAMLFAGPALAQSTGAADGSAPPPSPSSATTQSSPATTTQPTPATANPAPPALQQTRATSTSNPIVTKPTPTSAPSAPAIPVAITHTAAPTNPSTSTLTVPNALEDSSPLWIWLLIAGAAALLPFGYLASSLLKASKGKSEKNDGDDSQCFDLKQMLQRKLDEMSDLRGKVESEITDASRRLLRDSLKGTAAGQVIATLDAAEKDYGRIKRLYEQCMIDCGCNTLQGIIVENSLARTTILKKVLVEKSYTTDAWKLHDVVVKEKLLPELAEAMSEGPWYMHFWREGDDAVMVVFKNKTFDIKCSDTATWTDAVSYGESLGIPKEQLDFKVG